MKARWMFVFGSALLIALPAIAQERGQQHPAEPSHQNAEKEHKPPQANQGHVPPAPEARKNRAERPEPERTKGGKVISTPHVENNHWYGRARPNDPRYHLAHPFPHGHFEHFGPSYRYSIVRIDAGHHRFWLTGGYYFEVAPWEWSLCSDWCWTCPNDFVIYDDADHVGWYLLYNMQTGVFVHVQFMGS
ncbi:MAG TPA: hypothetical protein VLX32_02680 [Candidatus Acidoferrum sp.]|nr:hypothetical protein [Candidatus Acidoferrum sp.]